ncbi:MAG: hypothetical protein M3R62_01380 [Acidobacteriota bacterium]|nr:hypothetical protein [Acidobacteriota bacterium]MDQ2977843.1 hypothetical protein [Acidobacteriota bacterium]
MDRTEESGTPGPGHERNTVSVRGVIRFLVFLAVSLVVTSAVVWGIFRLLARDAKSEDRPLSPAVARSMARLPPQPRLEDRPLALRTGLNAQEKARLSGYGWVDRNAGAVHIPIERAMDLLVQRGIPAVQSESAATRAPAASGASGMPASAAAAAGKPAR